MKRNINFGKVDYLGIDKKTCEVIVAVELQEKKQGQEVLSICGEIWNNIKSDIYSGGQNLDTIKEFRKKLNNPKLFDRIYRFWKLYHLNNLHVGTQKQERAILKWEEKGNKYDYRKACEYLQSINLFSDNGYRYGYSWLYEPIPKEDLKEIKQIIRT